MEDRSMNAGSAEINSCSSNVRERSWNFVGRRDACLVGIRSRDFGSDCFEVSDASIDHGGVRPTSCPASIPDKVQLGSTVRGSWRRGIKGPRPRLPFFLIFPPNRLGRRDVCTSVLLVSTCDPRPCLYQGNPLLSSRTMSPSQNFPKKRITSILLASSTGKTTSTWRRNIPTNVFE